MNKHEVLQRNIKYSIINSTLQISSKFTHLNNVKYYTHINQCITFFFIFSTPINI